MACERFIKPGTRTKRDGPLHFDRTLKGCWGLLRGHEHDDRLVEAPRHAGEGAAVVRVDDEEERPAGERVQIAGVKAAADGRGGDNAENESSAAAQTVGPISYHAQLGPRNI